MICNGQTAGAPITSGRALDTEETKTMILDLTLDVAAPKHFSDLIRWYGANTRTSTSEPGHFDGIWTSEFGIGNTIVRLRTFDTLGDWGNAHEADKETTGEASARQPQCYLLMRERRALRAIRALRSDLEFHSGICELRIHDIVPGAVADFASAMLAVMSLREQYSANVGVWQPLTGSVNQLVHLWFYKDARERVAARGAVAHELQWQSYRRTVLPLVIRVQSSILTPIPR
ncbi:MAG: NIPSNAP family protein [Terriglobales bacterium]